MVKLRLDLYNAMTIDLVAVWDVPLQDGIHAVEFEHGTLTGKRVIRVDGKVCHSNIKFLILNNIFSFYKIH